MSVLLQQPNMEIFSTVPELEEVLQQFEDKRVASLIEAFGHIFVKHDMWQYFGLSIVHRHFTMSSNEVLVESIKDDHKLSVSVPFQVKGSLADPSDFSMWSSYAVSKKKFILPQNWCFSASGELIPFEYLASDDNKLPQPSAEFSKELYAALKELGVEQIVGLRSIAHLSGTTWETTPDGSRANVVVHGERPKELKDAEMVRVLWTFDKEGKLETGRTWCLVCLYCGSCNKGKLIT